MAKLLKLRRGTTTQHGSFTGAEGEVTIDTTKDTAVVHDGSQAGGRPLLREDMSNLPAGTIDNADINGSAAIAGTKISPDFGGQTISTTGAVDSAGMTISAATPTINFNDSNDNPDFRVLVNSNSFILEDTTNSATRIQVQSNGTVNIPGNIDAGAGIDVTGAITATGNLSITNAAPQLSLVDSNNDSDFQIILEGGTFNIKDTTNTANRLRINSAGTVETTGLLNAAGALQVTGNIGVTGTVDGRDVAADGTKLDGIEASATADQTAAEIRTLVESASDSNVFTDADHTKLNGIEASATADQTAAEIRSLVESASDSNVFTDADHTKLNGIETSATADQTGSEILALINSSNIYTTGAIGRDANDHIAFTDNTHMSININGSEEFRFEADGDFHADGDVTAQSTTISSDKRLKENIEPVSDALKKVQALNGVSFDWKKTGEKSAGVIAQEVIGVLPEAVKEVTPVGGGESHLAVNYHALTSILIEAIKELKAEVEELKGGA